MEVLCENGFGTLLDLFGRPKRWPGWNSYVYRSIYVMIMRSFPGGICCADYAQLWLRSFPKTSHDPKFIASLSHSLCIVMESYD